MSDYNKCVCGEIVHYKDKGNHADHCPGSSGDRLDELEARVESLEERACAQGVGVGELPSSAAKR